MLRRPPSACSCPKRSKMQYMPRLTDREIEILKWTAEGKSAWAVGQILNISEHNVKYHIKRILMKLAVGSSTKPRRKPSPSACSSTGRRSTQVFDGIVRAHKLTVFQSPIGSFLALWGD